MNEQPQTNMRIIMIVVITLAINATIGLCALGYCLVFKVEPNQTLLTAYLAIVTGLIGWLGGVLTKTSPTETTKVATVHPPDGITVGGPPTQVQVVNKPADPVPTVEA